MAEVEVMKLWFSRDLATAAADFGGKPGVSLTHPLQCPIASHIALKFPFPSFASFLLLGHEMKWQRPNAVAERLSQHSHRFPQQTPHHHRRQPYDWLCRCRIVGAQQQQQSATASMQRRSGRVRCAVIYRLTPASANQRTQSATGEAKNHAVHDWYQSL